MGKQKQQMQGYHSCQGTDRGVVEIRDSKFYDGEPAWFPGSPRPDGFYWFYFTDDHRIKDGRLCGPYPSLEAAAASAVAPNLSLQDIELALEALEADSRRLDIGTYHKTPLADPSEPQLRKPAEGLPLSIVGRRRISSQRTDQRLCGDARGSNGGIGKTLSAGMTGARAAWPRGEPHPP